MLGVRYLCIDSLSIIQGYAVIFKCVASSLSNHGIRNKTNLEIKGSAMAEIYGGAYLTLAATKSLSGEGGLDKRDLEFEIDGVHLDGRSIMLF